MYLASSVTSSAVASPLLVIARACLEDMAAFDPGSAKPLWIPDCSMSQAALSFTVSPSSDSVGH